MYGIVGLQINPKAIVPPPLETEGLIPPLGKVEESNISCISPSTFIPPWFFLRDDDLFGGWK